MSIQITPSIKLLLVTSMLALLSACGSGKPEQKPDNDQDVSAKKEESQSIRLTTEEIERAGISLITVAKTQVQDQLILTANIIANQDKLAHVTPRIEGKLSKVLVNLGDTVQTGAALAEIDSIPMGEARAQYRSSQSELALAQANYERINRLYEDKVVAQKQWLESKSVYERAKSASLADSERLRMYGGLNRTNDSTYVLTAPFKGIVLEKNAVIGELAKPADVIFTIADLSTVWIDADVPEAELRGLAIGKSAKVFVSAYPEETFMGKVSYVASQVDRATRTVKARIELPNPDGKLRIDMFARVALEQSTSDSRILVPSSAVIMIQGISNVYVDNGNGYEARAVELGERFNDSVEIKAGLTTGEKVVVTGVYELKARQLRSQISDSH